MSSSILSEFPSRRHVRIAAGLNRRHRNVYPKALKPKTLREEIQAFYARQVEGIAFIPSYLHNTVYAQLLEQQNILFKKIPYVKPVTKSRSEKDESPQKVKWRFVFKPDGTVETIPVVNQEESAEQVPSVSLDHTINGDSQLNRAVPSQKEYAALETLLQESFNYSLASHDLRLPTTWNSISKGDNIELSRGCLQVTYQGTGKEDSEASSIKTNHSMKKQCGIYYFEVQIMSKGIDGHIGIGFCQSMNSLDRLPGEEEKSWGYYGHNGHISSGPGTEKPYGPNFSTGDIIGCGVDFGNMSAFYTKNGVHLGTAFKGIKDTDMYPFVGFKTQGEKICTNFGSKTFKFDIKQHILIEKRNLVNTIASKPSESYHSCSEVINDSIAKNVADKLVLNYLRHHGYNSSANALEKRISLLNKDAEPMEEDEVADLDYIRRQDIRQLILDGNVDRVIDICDQYYPNVLRENVSLLFSLKCQKFLNMVQEAAEKKEILDKIATGRGEYEVHSLDVTNKDNGTAKRDYTITGIELFKSKKKKQRIEDNSDEGLEPFREVMVYGNELKKEYEQRAEEDSSIKDELAKTFSTLAYSDLSDPTVAYLFESSEKENLALKLNSAILVSLNRYPNSSIERIYQQTSTIVEELVLGGNAKAASLEPERDYLDIHHHHP